MRLAMMLSAVLCAVAAGVSVAQQPPSRLPIRVVAPNDDGWWIRVNTAATKATRIDWQFGTNPKDVAREDNWQPSGPLDTYFPKPLRYEKVVSVRSTTTPADAQASFCLFYGTQGVALVQFKGKDSTQANQKQTAAQCVL